MTCNPPNKKAWIFQNCSRDPGTIYKTKEEAYRRTMSGCGGRAAIFVPDNLKMPYQVKSFDDLFPHPIEKKALLLNIKT